MLEALLNLFRPSVNKVIASLQKKAVQLEKLTVRHQVKFDKHTALATLHAVESSRAAKIAGKFKDLIS